MKRPDYSVHVDLIPRPNPNQRPKKIEYREGLGSCSCEDHCLWDVCRLVQGPKECLLGSFSEWKWDNIKNGWVAQVILGSKI